MVKVSIIIPVFNAAGTIAQTIQSCLLQSPHAIEIILVDDFSTDESWQIIQDLQRQHPAVIKLVRNESKGGNAARNYGFSLASGAYIQWLDSDDLLLPGKLDAQVNFLERHPEKDIAYSDWQLDSYTEQGTKSTEYKRSRTYPDYLEELLKDNWLPPHAYLSRKPIVQKAIAAKGWNTTTSIAQDREYYTLCALLGAQFGYVEGNYCIYNRWKARISVSQSLKLNQRAVQLNVLLSRFIELIDSQSRINESDKWKYKRILYTQLVYHAAVFGAPAPLRPSVRQLDWFLPGGFRSKLKMLRWLLFPPPAH